MTTAPTTRPTPLPIGTAVAYRRTGTRGTVVRNATGITVETAYGTDWFSYRAAEWCLVEVEAS